MYRYGNFHTNSYKPNNKWYHETSKVYLIKLQDDIRSFVLNGADKLSENFNLKNCYLSNEV